MHARRARIRIQQCGDDGGRFEPRADEQQDGHDASHLVVEERSADEVEHVHAVAVAVVGERGDVGAEDAVPRIRELSGWVELAQVAKVVLADKTRCTRAHHVHVEVPPRKEVLAVASAAREACGEGGPDRCPCVDADRGQEDGVERVKVLERAVSSFWRCDRVEGLRTTRGRARGVARGVFLGHI